MAQARPASSLSKSQKTSPPSPSSITPAHQPKPEALAVVAVRFSADVDGVGVTSVVDEARFKTLGWAAVVVNKATCTIKGEEHGEAGAGVLAGRIMTSRNEIGIRLSISSRNGRCWRRSTLQGC